MQFNTFTCVVQSELCSEHMISAPICDNYNTVSLKLPKHGGADKNQQNTVFITTDLYIYVLIGPQRLSNVLQIYLNRGQKELSNDTKIIVIGLQQSNTYDSQPSNLNECDVI